MNWLKKSAMFCLGIRPKKRERIQMVDTPAIRKPKVIMVSVEREDWSRPMTREEYKREAQACKERARQMADDAGIPKALETPPVVRFIRPKRNRSVIEHMELPEFIPAADTAVERIIEQDNPTVTFMRPKTERRKKKSNLIHLPHRVPQHPIQFSSVHVPKEPLLDDYPDNPEKLYHEHLERIQKSKKPRDVQTRQASFAEWKACDTLYQRIRKEHLHKRSTG